MCTWTNACACDLTDALDQVKQEAASLEVELATARAEHEEERSRLKLLEMDMAKELEARQTSFEAEVRKKSCCSLGDARDARMVAAGMGIPFQAVDLAEEFGDIIDYFVGEYRARRPPLGRRRRHSPRGYSRRYSSPARSSPDSSLLRIPRR